MRRPSARGVSRACGPGRAAPLGWPFPSMGGFGPSQPVQTEPMTEPRDGHQAFEVTRKPKSPRSWKASDPAESVDVPTSEFERRANRSWSEPPYMGGIAPDRSRHRAGNCHDKLAAGSRNATHLPQSWDRILEVFENVFCQHAVEDAHTKWQCTRVCDDIPIRITGRNRHVVDVHNPCPRKVEAGVPCTHVEQPPGWQPGDKGREAHHAAVLVRRCYSVHGDEATGSGRRVRCRRCSGGRCCYYNALTDGAHFDAGFDRSVQWDVDLHDGYAWSTLKGDSGVRRVLGAWRQLHHLRPSVVICFGWATRIARAALVWAIVTRTPVLFYGDTTWQIEPTGWRRWVRKISLRNLFRLSAGALATGTFNREFYIRLGMGPRRVRPGVCPVDIPAFQRAAQSRNPSGEVVIGFAGKLTERKGADELIRALALIRDQPGWRGRIIGDGPLRQQLEGLVNQSGLQRRIDLIGFVNTSGMPDELACCDVVVVPSRFDLRVLVSAEAMAAGAVVVVSSNTAVWGAGDLIEDGVTGFVYPSGDRSALAAILENLVRDESLRDRVRTASMQRVTRFGPETFASTLETAVVDVLRS